MLASSSVIHGAERPSVVLPDVDWTQPTRSISDDWRQKRQDGGDLQWPRHKGHKWHLTSLTFSSRLSLWHSLLEYYWMGARLVWREKKMSDSEQRATWFSKSAPLPLCGGATVFTHQLMARRSGVAHSHVSTVPFLSDLISWSLG